MPVQIVIPEPEHHDPIESAVLQRLRDSSPSLIAEYLRKNQKEGITFIARDAAKRVFPEYLEDTTRNNRLVDAAASALADFIRRKLLDSPPLLPRNRIMIVTGAPASGKTVAASTLRLPTTEIVHETILTSPEKASRIVREALHAKRVPRINLFYTEDPRLNVRRMILRARRIGRTVPVAYMAKAYSGVPRIVRDLSREYKKSLELLIANNSGAEDQVVFHQRIEEAVHSTGRYTEVECLEIMDRELGEIHQAEKIPDSILQEARLR